MFREMRRHGQQLTREECEHVLATAKRGVLSLSGDDGYPYGVPINFCYDPVRQAFYFHGAKVGHKIDSIGRDSKASFATWAETEVDKDGWSWHLESVIAFGRIELVKDEERARRMGLALADRFYPTHEESQAEWDHAGKRVQMLALHVEHMTGKRVHEK